MAHKPYNLYKRATTKSNKFIYYCQFYDDSGKRSTAISTGQTSKAAAENWAIEQINKGFIVQKRNMTLAQYAKDWWIWGKCKYTKSKIARGHSISRSYVNSSRTNLTRHILPFFGNKKLIKITPKMIEDWIMELREKPGRLGEPLTATTVNRCYTTLKIMLKEAIRLGYLNSNPAFFIGQLKEKPKEKDILSIDEVKELLSEDNIDYIWNSDIMQYTLNLLAASSGIRCGEGQALQVQNVHEEYVSIIYNWDKKYGLKSPKGGSTRDIPIPSKTSIYLQKLISLSPYQGPEDFVFFGINRGVPIYYKKIREVLYKAFENIGISADERKERNITFHSWRHLYNTLMRGKIHDAKLRRLTGHRTQEMTEHYTHFSIDDFKDVLMIQEEYFK